MPCSSTCARPTSGPPATRRRPPGSRWASSRRGIDELPRDRRILAICRSGGRSAAVTEALNGAGFDAANVVGGMQSWARSGLDVIADDGAAGTVI